MRQRIADLYCGAGGAAKGLHDAGFDVVGFDNRPQPRYPFEFHMTDALTVDLGTFDAVWASPPCQAFSNVANHARASGLEYPDLVDATRHKVEESELPWIIENVVGSPLRLDLMICGSMFDPPMDVRRHRIFESNIPLQYPMWPCRHALMGPRFELYEHYKQRLSSTVRVNGGYTKGASEAMEIHWMTRKELTQAVPPRYSAFLGKQLIEYVRAT